MGRYIVTVDSGAQTQRWVATDRRRALREARLACDAGLLGMSRAEVTREGADYPLAKYLLRADGVVVPVE